MITAGLEVILRSYAHLCPQFKAGVSWHPSHSPISGLVGEEEKTLLAPVTCPQLFMPGQVILSSFWSILPILSSHWSILSILSSYWSIVWILSSHWSISLWSILSIFSSHWSTLSSHTLNTLLSLVRGTTPTPGPGGWPSSCWETRWPSESLGRCSTAGLSGEVRARQRDQNIHQFSFVTDMSDPVVSRDVKLAINETLEFLKVNLWLARTLHLKVSLNYIRTSFTSTNVKLR